MGGKTSGRWHKGYRREPSVEETWVIDCDQLVRFAGGKKTDIGKFKIFRKTPPGSMLATFVLKGRTLLITFWKKGKRGDLWVSQNINFEAVDRQGHFPAQWAFICPHCGKHFTKLYMRDDDRYNDEEFCCRNGIGLTYASRVKHDNTER